MYSFSKMNVLLASAGVALLLASAPNANAAKMDRGLRGVDAMAMDAVDADAAAADGTSGASHSRRQLQNSLGDWAFCTDSSQCQNQCCSSKYSTSDGRLKCTPVGGFKPSEGCVGGPPSPKGCWGTDTRCLAGTTCNSCCNGDRWVWHWFGHHCN